MSNVQSEIPKRLSVSPAIHKKLKALAVEQDRALQELTEEFLIKGLNENEKAARASAA